MRRDTKRAKEYKDEAQCGGREVGGREGEIEVGEERKWAKEYEEEAQVRRERRKGRGDKEDGEKV